LIEEALDLTLWRIRFGRDYGPVVRQTTEWINRVNFGRRMLGKILYIVDKSDMLR
jgi:hypothetical protein